MHRRLAVAAIASAVALAFSACSVLPLACPAVAYIASVEVAAATPTGANALLRVCIEGECVIEGEPVDHTDASAVRIQRHDSGDWNVVFGMRRPESLELTIVDVGGDEVARDRYSLDWVRTGGSEHCGGPMETAPLTLPAG